jgi:hypothetical protein
MVRQHNQDGDEILPVNSSGSKAFGSDNPVYNRFDRELVGSNGLVNVDQFQNNVQYGPKNVFSTASLPIPVKKPVLPDSAGIDLTSSVGKRRLSRRN